MQRLINEHITANYRTGKKGVGEKLNSKKMKIIYKIALILFISSSAFCQIQVTYPNSSWATFNLEAPGGTGEGGSNIYSYTDVYGYKYQIIRLSNKWHIRWFKSTDGNGSFGRTAQDFETLNPPCGAIWYTGQNQTWLGNTIPNPIPPVPSSQTLTSVSITGSSCLSATMVGQFANIEPTFIQLPRLNSTPSTTVSSDEGKIIFDKSSLDLEYNNGYSWLSVWPKAIGNYDLSNGQKIIFGSNSNINSQSINGLNIESDLIKFRDINSNDNLLINSGASNINSAKFRILTSISTKFRTSSVSTTITNDDHTIVYSGTGGGHTFTLPTGSGYIGAEFIIVNHGNALSALTISPSLKNGFNSTVSQLPVGYSFNVVSDGTDWRLVSKSQL